MRQQADVEPNGFISCGNTESRYCLHHLYRPFWSYFYCLFHHCVARPLRNLPKVNPIALREFASVWLNVGKRIALELGRDCLRQACAHQPFSTGAKSNVKKTRQELHLTQKITPKQRGKNRLRWATTEPGGVLLAAVPGITLLDTQLRHTQYWAFTCRSMHLLFERYFNATQLTISSHGNVLSAIAGLQGLSASELQPEELSVCDPDFAVVITVRATKS